MFQRLLTLFCLLHLMVLPVRAADFRGVVLSSDGAPVAGAHVWIGPTRLLEYSVAKGTLLQVVTGADGMFSVEFSGSTAVSRWAFARVQNEKWALRDILLEAGPNANNRIELEARKGIGGTVEPLQPDKTVRLRYIGNMGNISATGEKTLFEETSGSISWMLWAESLPVLEVTSDDQRKWEFPQVNSGMVRVGTETYGASIISTYQDSESPGAARRIVVRTQPPVDIEGDIVSSDGNPLAGVIVTYGWRSGSSAYSDVKGHFVLRRVPRDPNLDPLQLRAVAPGNAWLLPKREVPL